MSSKTFITALAICAVAGLGIQVSADQASSPDTEQPDRGGGGGSHPGKGHGHRPPGKGQVVCNAQDSATGAMYSGSGNTSANAQRAALSACAAAGGTQCVATGCD